MTIILECLSDLLVGACRPPSSLRLLTSDCGTVVYHICTWLGWRRRPPLRSTVRWEPATSEDVSLSLTVRDLYEDIEGV